MKRVISLWLPRFATDRLSLRLGVSPSEWRARPFATVETGPTGPRLAAINRAAREQGLGNEIPADSHDVLAMQLIRFDGLVIEIYVMVFAHWNN